jgi:hypothetical protein
MTEHYKHRLDAQLRLALLGDCGCPEILANLDANARHAGLTGAEIDAALAGRSFDARTATAIAFAQALKLSSPPEIRQARRRARRLGFSAAELTDIERKVGSILQEGVHGDE